MPEQRLTTLAFQTEKMLPTNVIATTYVTRSFQNATEVFHGYYTYPRFPASYPQADKLNQFYLNQYTSGYREMSDIRSAAFLNVLPANTVYAYDHTFEIPNSTKDYISIVENTISYAGGAQPSDFTEAHTFSLKDGLEKSLSYFLQHASINEETFRNSLIRSLKDNPDIFPPNTEQLLVNKDLDSFSFYVNDKGIVIFFNPGEIAPSAQGIVKFQLPLHITENYMIRKKRIETLISILLLFIFNKLIHLENLNKF